VLKGKQKKCMLFILPNGHEITPIIKNCWQVCCKFFCCFQSGSAVWLWRRSHGTGNCSIRSHNRHATHLVTKITLEISITCINTFYFKDISRIQRPLRPASIFSMWCDEQYRTNLVALLRAIDRSAPSVDRAVLSSDCAAHSTDPPIENIRFSIVFCHMPL